MLISIRWLAGALELFTERIPSRMHIHTHTGAPGTHALGRFGFEWKYFPYSVSVRLTHSNRVVRVRVGRKVWNKKSYGQVFLYRTEFKQSWAFIWCFLLMPYLQSHSEMIRNIGIYTYTHIHIYPSMSNAYVLNASPSKS